MAGEVSALAFETRYLRLFEGEPTHWPEPVFHILDELFYWVDAYCADPELRRPDKDLNDDQLREKAALALTELRATTS